MKVSGLHKINILDDPCFEATQKKKKFSSTLEGVPVLRTHPKLLGRKVWNAVELSCALLRELLSLATRYLPEGSDTSELRVNFINLTDS